VGTLRGFICLLLIMGFLAMSGCGSRLKPEHPAPGDNMPEPPGLRPSQTFDGAEVVLVAAAVTVLVVFVLVAIAIETYARL